MDWNVIEGGATAAFLVTFPVFLQARSRIKAAQAEKEAAAAVLADHVREAEATKAAALEKIEATKAQALVEQETTRAQAIVEVEATKAHALAEQDAAKAQALADAESAKLKTALLLQEQISHTFERLNILENRCIQLEARCIDSEKRLSEKDGEIADLRRQIDILKSLQVCVPATCVLLAGRNNLIADLERRLGLTDKLCPPL